MARRVVLSAVASAAICLGAGAASAAASPVHLLLSGNGAFAVLGHWCGGIKQKVYATGFASNGYPTGVESLSTTCSSGGRGSKPVTFTAQASSVWDWYGDTRSYSAISSLPEGISESFSAEDSHGDHIYNVGASAYLEAPSPPIQPPAAPTNLTAYVSEVEVGEKVELRFATGWTPAGETAALLTSSHVVATPVNSNAPVLETTVSGGASNALLAPLARRTEYLITVTNTDPEGTSPPTQIEINSISPEEEHEIKEEEAAPNPPEFGLCVKALSEKIGTTTYYYGGYTTATCTAASSTHSGKYEWDMGVVKGGFKTALKLAPVTLESVNRTKLTCSGESGTGNITGRKTVGGVGITLTGCVSGTQNCTTSGHAEGEIASNTLEGALGVERITITKEGKEVVHIGLDLYPAGKAGPLFAYTCGSGEPQTLSGSVIAPVTSGRMQTSSTLKFSQTAGLQKPEELEEGPRDVLTLGFGEQVGLSLNTLLSTEEPVEINPAF
jgi:hypothetical protein